MPTRYRDNPVVPAVFEGRIAASARERRLAQVSWTEVVPRAWKSTTLAPGDLDVRVEVDTGDGLGWQVLSRNEDGASADGSGSYSGVCAGGALGDGTWASTSRSRQVPANASIRYKIVFENPGGISPLPISPYVDDLTFQFETGAKLRQVYQQIGLRTQGQAERVMLLEALSAYEALREELETYVSGVRQRRSTDVQGWVDWRIDWQDRLRLREIADLPLGPLFREIPEAWAASSAGAACWDGTIGPSSGACTSRSRPRCPRTSPRWPRPSATSRPPGPNWTAPRRR